MIIIIWLLRLIIENFFDIYKHLKYIKNNIDKNI